MATFLADEDVSYDLVRALRRTRIDINVVTAQQLNMAGANDEDVLDRAFADGRVVITSDRNTMLGIRHARVAAGVPVPGIIGIDALSASFRTIVDELVFLAEVAGPRDWANPIFVPLH